MSGFSRSDFSPQIEALEFSLRELTPRLQGKPFALGGGTALALFYFMHRRSFDLDFFVYEYSAMPLLAAKMYVDDYDFLSKDYTDLAEHIRLTTTTGVKIDFLFSPNLTRSQFQPRAFSNLSVAVESVSEIIAKKIHYRAKNLKARDVFDIAVSLEKNSDLFGELMAAKVLQIDDLYYLHQGVSAMSPEKYRNEMRFTAPYQEFESISENALAIIAQSIEKAKREYLASL